MSHRWNETYRRFWLMMNTDSLEISSLRSKKQWFWKNVSEKNIFSDKSGISAGTKANSGWNTCTWHKTNVVKRRASHECSLSRSLPWQRSVLFRSSSGVSVLLRKGQGFNTGLNIVSKTNSPVKAKISRFPKNFSVPKFFWQMSLFRHWSDEIRQGTTYSCLETRTPTTRRDNTPRNAEISPYRFSGQQHRLIQDVLTVHHQWQTYIV